MLNELRKGTTNILIKALLLVVVMSFVIWGVGDMFRGKTNNDAASVGDSAISVREYDRTLRQQMKRIQAMTGGAITSEQIAAMQVDRMVLNQLVNTKLIEIEANALGIRIGKDIVQDQVVKDPAFADASGKFDKNKFLELLRSNDLTENDFVELVKSGMASDFLVDGITSTQLNMDGLAKALYAARNEQRKVDILTLKEDNIAPGSIAAPSEQDLTSYYNDHKDEYTVPGYRMVSYITLKANALEPTVDDATLQKRYEEQKSQYQIPERRDLDNMLFTDEAKAKQAWERLNKKEDFYKLAKELTGAEKADVDLGRISKDGIFKDVADVVFSLPKDAYSAPVKGPFGWYIFRIRDIIPASQQSFAEVKDQIAAQIKSEKVGDALSKRVNEIEDAVASGSTLEEIAKTYQLEIASVKDVSKEGKDSNGQPANLGANADVVLKLAFETNQGDISPLTVTPGNAEYVAVRVDGVTEPRTKALDEVRGLVQTSWKEGKLQEALKKQADELAGKLKQSTAWQEATKDLKVQIETGKKIGRVSEKQEELPEGLREEIFTRKSGEHTGAYPHGKGHIIALVREVMPAANDELKLNMVKQELASGIANDIMEQYNVYLRGKYPVSVNEQLLKKKE